MMKYPCDFTEENLNEIATALSDFLEHVGPGKMHPGHALLSFCVALLGRIGAPKDNIHMAKKLFKDTVDEAINAYLDGYERMQEIKKMCQTDDKN